MNILYRYRLLGGVAEFIETLIHGDGGWPGKRGRRMGSSLSLGPYRLTIEASNRYQWKHTVVNFHCFAALAINEVDLTKWLIYVLSVCVPKQISVCANCFRFPFHLSLIYSHHSKQLKDSVNICIQKSSILLPLPADSKSRWKQGFGKISPVMGTDHFICVARETTTKHWLKELSLVVVHITDLIQLQDYFDCTSNRWSSWAKGFSSWTFLLSLILLMQLHFLCLLL